MTPSPGRRRASDAEPPTSTARSSVTVALAAVVLVSGLGRAVVPSRRGPSEQPEQAIEALSAALGQG